MFRVNMNVNNDGIAIATVASVFLLNIIRLQQTPFATRKRRLLTTLVKENDYVH